MHNTTPTQVHASPDVMTLVNELITADGQHTVESKLLKPKLIRRLYKILGEPTSEDFPEEFETAGVCGFARAHSYTTHFFIATEDAMLKSNAEPTEYNIKQPSETKQRIIERYRRDGWHCKVYSFNVICEKFVKHPRYPGVWVWFYSSRDCSTYTYVLERPNDSNA